MRADPKPIRDAAWAAMVGTVVDRFERTLVQLVRERGRGPISALEIERLLKRAADETRGAA